MKTVRFLLLLLLLAAPLRSVTHYVALNGGHVPPFTNGWASAASNIQSVVDVALPGDAVLVSNGVYASGTRVTPGYALLNRVCVTQSLTLASLNGPAVTVIAGAPDPVTSGCGDNAVRGIYVEAGWLIG
ncbi:MAG: hypothetical protein NTV22_01995, partial [bacterium]|nr:hypothetical protein [bacterium]